MTIPAFGASCFDATSLFGDFSFKKHNTVDLTLGQRGLTIR